METKTRYRSTFRYNGKKYEATGKSQREADIKAALKKEKLERGEIGISSDMTVAKWADEWLETYKRPFVSASHFKRYESYIKRIINPSIGHLRLKNVKDVHLQKILNDREGKSKSDISKLKLTICSMFKKAYKSKLILFDPSEDLMLPSSTEGQRRSITGDERKAILKVAETHRAGLWFKTILYCGLRPAEVAALEWRHIDFDKKMIHVRQAMKHASNDIGKPKSAAGTRDVPIPDFLITDFEQVKKDSGEHDPVFSQTVTRNHHTQNSMRKLWLSFRRELDIYMGAKLYRNQIIESSIALDLSPYCLRHTYCTDLQDAGVPINIARYLMGHSEITTTSKIYTHTTYTAINDAAIKINAFGGKDGGKEPANLDK